MRFRFSEGAERRRAAIAARKYLSKQRLNDHHEAPVLSFREFIRKVDPTFVFYPHVDKLVDALQKVADGEITRLMIFMPPRHFKSVTVSKLFSSYYLHRYPERWVALAAYSTELAHPISRSARQFYQESGRELSREAWSVKNWETGAGGGMWVTSCGGPATGRGGSLLIVDDPIKSSEEAQSTLYRERLKDWWSAVWYTRKEPKANAFVVLQTRWHEDDLSGWLLSKEIDTPYPERWHVISMAAIKDDETVKVPDSCTLEPDDRTTGDALAPDWIPIEELRKTEANIGRYFWNSLYQQRPSARDGTFFRREWFEIVDAVPAAQGRVVRAYDIASTKDDGDYTVGLKMLRVGDMYYILDVVRGRWDSTTRDQIIRQTAMLDGISTKIFIEKQPGSAGVDMAKNFTRLLSGFSVISPRPTGDKQDRADPFASQIGAGNVKLLRGDWNSEYIDEFISFPTGAHDDQVDATSLAFNRLAVSPTITTIVR